MKTVSNTSTEIRSLKINRLMYAGFLALAVFYLILGEWQNATVALGVGLIADPFDYRVTWAKRPLWQRAWLLGHLAVLFGLIIYTVFTKI